MSRRVSSNRFSSVFSAISVSTEYEGASRRPQRGERHTVPESLRGLAFDMGCLGQTLAKPQKPRVLIYGGEHLGDALALGPRSDLLGLGGFLGQPPMVILPFSPESAPGPDQKVL